MPDPFQHISHRVSNSGSARGRSMRDGMMDEAARFSRDIKEAMAEERGRQAPKQRCWKRFRRAPGMSNE